MIATGGHATTWCWRTAGTCLGNVFTPTCAVLHHLATTRGTARRLPPPKVLTFVHVTTHVTTHLEAIIR